jgi:hypothetical protein
MFPAAGSRPKEVEEEEECTEAREERSRDESQGRSVEVGA